jgi:hypothetical protein
VSVVNRTAKFVSAIAASAFAGVLLASMPCSAAGAPDDCLAAPTGAAPQGQHWYYRLDRATKRQCWYVREQIDKTSQAAAPSASASTRAPVRQPEAVADAHAEWLASQPGNEPDTTASISAPAPSTANPARSQGGQIATPQLTSPPQAVIGSRGPDSSSVSTPTAAAPSTVLADASPAPEAAPPSAGVTPVALTTTDTASEKASGSVLMLFLVIAGALALAGITASIIYRVGAHYRALREFDAHRRVSWEPVGDSDTAPWSTQEHDWNEASEFRESEDDLGRKIDQPADQPTDAEVGRITELLEQLIRQGPKLDRTVSATGFADSGQSRRG